MHPPAPALVPARRPPLCPPTCRPARCQWPLAAPPQSARKERGSAGGGGGGDGGKGEQKHCRCRQDTAQGWVTWQLTRSAPMRSSCVALACVHAVCAQTFKQGGQGLLHLHAGMLLGLMHLHCSPNMLPRRLARSRRAARTWRLDPVDPDVRTAAPTLQRGQLQVNPYAFFSSSRRCLTGAPVCRGWQGWHVQNALEASHAAPGTRPPPQLPQAGEHARDGRSQAQAPTSCPGQESMHSTDAAEQRPHQRGPKKEDMHTGPHQRPQVGGGDLAALGDLRHRADEQAVRH